MARRKREVVDPEVEKSAGAKETLDAAFDAIRDNESYLNQERFMTLYDYLTELKAKRGW